MGSGRWHSFLSPKGREGEGTKNEEPGNKLGNPCPAWHLTGMGLVQHAHSQTGPVAARRHVTSTHSTWRSALGSAGACRCSGRTIRTSPRSVMQAGGGMRGRKAGRCRDLLDRVGDALLETSTEVIEPRLATLASMDVRAKKLPVSLSRSLMSMLKGSSPGA